MRSLLPALNFHLLPEKRNNIAVASEEAVVLRHPFLPIQLSKIILAPSTWGIQPLSQRGHSCRRRWFKSSSATDVLTRKLVLRAIRLASRRSFQTLGTVCGVPYVQATYLGKQTDTELVLIPLSPLCHTCGLWSPSATFRLQIRGGEQFGIYLLVKNY